MPEDAAFEKINEAKANMDNIYNQLDPRAYFRELKKLTYTIPGKAQPIFRKLTRHLRQTRNGKVQILDLGCSYGINAALLKYDLSLSELYDHWSQKRLSEATPKEVIEYDGRFFSRLDKKEDVEVVGMDEAENAVAFGLETGLLDEGIVLNLETESLSKPTRQELKKVDLVISSGAVGYLTEKSFDKIMPTVTQQQPAWLANFVLRMFPFDAIEETLKNQGYLTEKLKNRTFVQRRFASSEEQEEVLTLLYDHGIDLKKEETEGYLLAEFYLSRPANDVLEKPMEELLAA